jgi:hypothetical protein
MRVLTRRSVLSLLAAGLLLALVPGTARAIRVIFNDGFVIQGRVTRPYTILVDKASGRPFELPETGTLFSIEDEMRRTLFSPGQVENVKQDLPPASEPIRIMSGPLLPPKIMVPGPIVELTEWDAKWERNAVVYGGPQLGNVKTRQRITQFTPEYIRVDSVDRRWFLFYHPSELGPELLARLLYDQYTKTTNKKKKLSEPEARLNVARYLLQAGWADQAAKELDGMPKNDFQEQTERVREEIQRTRDTEALEALDRAARLGRPREAQQRLDDFFKNGLNQRVDAKQLAKVIELRKKLAATDKQLALARGLLQKLPDKIAVEQRGRYAAAADAIVKELHPDTLSRLEAFLEEGRSYEQALKVGRAPTLSAEKLLSLAMTGWVLGGGATAESDPDIAAERWQVRQLVLDYQKAEGEDARKRLLKGWAGSERGNPAVVARVIAQLPPPEPFEKVGEKPFEIKVKPANGAKAITALVQLPPEYHHLRPYPVLFVLHRLQEKPADMLAKWSKLASQNGYILVAPEWEVTREVGYHFSDDEHASVVECLRDLRRRFQVDSDRVFLFGAEHAGVMAFDVGLSHPDLFAGVMTMNATPELFAGRYWPNGQYLPFFVVEGERRALAPKINRRLFEHWIRYNYPSLYVEYRGRERDWFAGELPRMVDWMNRKKRTYPKNELGKTTHGSPFISNRSTDDHFYWASADELDPRCRNDEGWNPARKAATIQADITGGNILVVRTSGVKKLTIWLGQGMINYEKKLEVRLNGHLMGKTIGNNIRPSLEVLLEDFARRGDRQMLFLSKLTMRP